MKHAITKIINRIKQEKEKLKSACENDTQKLFSLRERIEDVEKQMVLKMAEGCRNSDITIKENSKKIESCWARVCYYIFLLTTLIVVL